MRAVTFVLSRPCILVLATHSVRDLSHLIRAQSKMEDCTLRKMPLSCVGIGRFAIAMSSCSILVPSRSYHIVIVLRTATHPTDHFIYSHCIKSAFWIHSAKLEAIVHALLLLCLLRLSRFRKSLMPPSCLAVDSLRHNGHQDGSGVSFELGSRNPYELGHKHLPGYDHRYRTSLPHPQESHKTFLACSPHSGTGP